MGLDMYLYAETYFSEYEHKEKIETIASIFDKRVVNDKNFIHGYVKIEAMYWGKSVLSCQSRERMIKSIENLEAQLAEIKEYLKSGKEDFGRKELVEEHKGIKIYRLIDRDKDDHEYAFFTENSSSYCATVDVAKRSIEKYLKDKKGSYQPKGIYQPIGDTNGNLDRSRPPQGGSVLANKKGSEFGG